MSFGTGHHETTRLCLKAIENLDCAGKSVLDIGTGTGALAMYALIRGAKFAVGIDTDEWSYKNVIENKELNSFSKNEFDVRHGDLASAVESEEHFDIILANIHRNILLAIVNEIKAHHKKGGRLILSGILEYDTAEVLDAYQKAGYVLIHEMQENEWIALDLELEIVMRQAVIDIGTNTCLLLIAESDRAGTMKVIADVHAIARLGAGVDKTKRIQSESYERLRKILLDYRTILSEKKMDAVAAVATSAMRDAENRDDITRRVKEECGFDIEVLTGEDESIWSYRGAMCGLLADELQGRVAALDIGGGSTELSIGENGKFIIGKSINIGAVRIKERFLTTNNSASVKSAREFIASELKTGFGDIKTHKLIAVAGTPTALAAMKLKLQTFEAEKINGVLLSQTELSVIIEELLTLSPQELVKKYPAIHPDRADILPSGALILEETLIYLNLNEMRVSTFGLRYGIMIREFERQMKTEADEWIITPRIIFDRTSMNLSTSSILLNREKEMRNAFEAISEPLPIAIRTCDG